MQRTKGSNGWAVFTVVAVIALGSTIASAGIGRAGDPRLAQARAVVGVECINVGTVSLCAAGDATRPAPQPRSHDQRLAQARTSRSRPYLNRE